MTKHYQTLGVTPNASADEIKKAFKRLASKYHPDREGGDAEMFKQINEAHELLSDPERRARYDATGDDTPVPSLDMEADALIASIFMQVAQSVGWRQHQYASAIMGHLGDEAREADKELNHHTQRIRTLKDMVLPKFTGDNNVIKGLVDQHIGMSRERVEQAEHRLTVIGKAIEHMGNYEDVETPGEWHDIPDTMFIR